MTKFFFKKFFILLSSLFVVATLTFFFMHLLPGDPFTQEQSIPEEVLQVLRHHHGLDQPWYIQYGRYIKGLCTMDLGPSFKYPGRTVIEIINAGLPISMILGLQALLIAVSLGTLIGAFAASKHGRWEDTAAITFSVLAISVPSFILATFLQYSLSMKLALFPVARWGTFAHSVLPSISLAALPTAFIGRLTRANMIEVMQQDYIQTARAKGLSENIIVLKHGVRNAFFPIITYLGPLAASVLTGSFAVEKIFGIPGIGQWFVRSITNRDYTVIMGITMFYSALLIFCVFIVDVLYKVLDPRVGND